MNTVARAAISDQFKSAFSKFMRENQNRVFTRALRLLADRKQAEDIVQEVFLKAYQEGPSLWSDLRAGAWLSTVARNLCFNHLTRYKKRYLNSSTLTDDDMDPLDVKDEHSTVGLNPAEVLEKENQSSRLQEALMRLPNHQRIPLVLFHFDELSYEEIAKALNISLSKIKTDIHRGRAALATVLDPVQMGVV